MVISARQKERFVAGNKAIAIHVLVTILFSIGCGPSPQEAIEGTYRVDLKAMEQSETLNRLSSQPKQWALLLGSTMLRAVHFTIKDKACARGVAGRQVSLDCSFIRVDKKKTVVYRSVDSLGRIQFLRATRTKKGLNLEIDGRIVPLLQLDESQPQ